MQNTANGLARVRDRLGLAHLCPRQDLQCRTRRKDRDGFYGRRRKALGIAGDDRPVRRREGNGHERNVVAVGQIRARSDAPEKS